MKKYFKDIDTETKIYIVLNNTKLRENVERDYYEYLMDEQYEEGTCLLGERYNGVDIRDHYSTFYLVLTDWEKFLNNLDKDYLCQDGLDLYDKIMKLKEEHDNIDLDENEEKYYELEETLENMCKDLLKICEKQLHEYENYTEEDLKESLRFNFENNGMYDNYYIKNNDLAKVYNDVSYTVTFE